MIDWGWIDNITLIFYREGEDVVVDLDGRDVYVDVDLDGEGGDGVVRGVAEGGLASAGQRPLPRHGLVS